MPAKQLSVTVVIAVLMFVGACISGALWADGVYAKKSELRQVIVAAVRAANASREQELQDKIFALDLIPETHKTDIDRAILNRSRAQLQDVQSRVRAMEQESKGN